MKLFFILSFILTIHLSFGQKGEKQTRFFGDPIITDSSSTVLIPISYDPDNSSMSKFSAKADFFVNIVFYNFLDDSSKKLFNEDTYIELARKLCV